MYSSSDPVPFDADPSDALAEKLAWEDAALHEWNRTAHEVAKAAKRLAVVGRAAHQDRVFGRREVVKVEGWDELQSCLDAYERALRVVSGEEERDG